MSKQEYETIFLKDHTKHILFTINASTKTPMKATLENNLQRGQRKDQKINQKINVSCFGLSVFFSSPEHGGYTVLRSYSI